MYITYSIQYTIYLVYIYYILYNIYNLYSILYINTIFAININYILYIFGGLGISYIESIYYKVYLRQSRLYCIAVLYHIYV